MKWKSLTVNYLSPRRFANPDLALFSDRGLARRLLKSPAV
jgi:hypothetical protein